MPPQLHSQACLSCGVRLQGQFCAACGEPAVHDHDLGLRHMAHEFLHEFTHIDGKIGRTLLALLFQPGRLTAEYWAGHRGNWIRPLRLYVAISALTFLLAANATGPLGFRIVVDASHNYVIGNGSGRPGHFTPIDATMTHHVQSIYLWLRYLSLCIFAAASLAVYRKSRRFFGAHLIYALHFYSFEFLLSGVISRLWPAAHLGIPMAMGFVYLYLSLRHLYRQRWWLTLAKAIFLFTAIGAAEAAILAGCVLDVIWTT